MASKTNETLSSSKLDTGYTFELKIFKSRKTSILVTDIISDLPIKVPLGENTHFY